MQDNNLDFKVSGRIVSSVPMNLNMLEYRFFDFSRNIIKSGKNIIIFPSIKENHYYKNKNNFATYNHSNGIITILQEDLYLLNFNLHIIAPVKEMPITIIVLYDCDEIEKYNVLNKDDINNTNLLNGLNIDKYDYEVVFNQYIILNDLEATISFNHYINLIKNQKLSIILIYDQLTGNDIKISINKNSSLKIIQLDYFK